MTAELKWTKITNQKYAEYQAFVDAFFIGAKHGMWSFHCMVLDTRRIDYGTYHQGDKDLGFYKFFYQLLLHPFGRRVGRDDQRVVVHFDERQSNYSLADFRVILNRGLAKQYGITSEVIREVKAIRSHDSDVLQTADILMGAVGFHWNRVDLVPGTRQAKIDLANYIASQVGMATLRQRTPKKLHHFTIWFFRLK